MHDVYFINNQEFVRVSLKDKIFYVFLITFSILQIQLQVNEKITTLVLKKIKITVEKMFGKLNG